MLGYVWTHVTSLPAGCESDPSHPERLSMRVRVTCEHAREHAREDTCEHGRRGEGTGACGFERHPARPGES